MAEIKIEKKKPIWPWILAIVALLALVLFFVWNDRDETDEVAETTMTTPPVPNRDYTGTDGAVAAYVQYVENTTGEMGLDHEYSGEALTKLMKATEAKANQIGYNARTDLDQVQTYVDKIETDPYETSHANSIQKAAELMTTTLQHMQQAHYPQLSDEVSQLQEASAAINPDELTLNQKEEVKAYFEEAAELLQKMNESTLQTEM